MTFKKSKRYDVSSLVEAQFELGSQGRVLKNLLSIKSKREMDRVEASEQLRIVGRASPASGGTIMSGRMPDLPRNHNRLTQPTTYRVLIATKWLLP